MNKFFWKILPYTAKWIWDRSIFSIIKPSFDIILFSRFLKICTDLQAICSIERKIVFVIVSEQFCIHMLQISCKSSEILEQCHVKWWFKYRNDRSVSWRLSCTWEIMKFRIGCFIPWITQMGVTVKSKSPKPQTTVGELDSWFLKGVIFVCGWWVKLLWICCPLWK